MIYIIDEVMGRGKTTAMINHINAGDIPRPILFVTPYNTETQRIVDACPGFITPKRERYKFVDAMQFMSEKKDLAVTHTLFSMADARMRDIARRNGYTLVIDEAPNLINHVPIAPADAGIITKYLAAKDPDTLRLSWVRDDYQSGKYENYMNLINGGEVYAYNSHNWLSMTPTSTLLSFRNVYVLTYMFQGSTMRQYLDLHVIPYTRLYVGGDSPDTYRLYESPQPQPAYDYRSLIRIEDREKLNGIGRARTALSKGWYLRHTDHMGIDAEIKRLKANTNNFFTNYTNTHASQNLWTTYSSANRYDDTPDKDRIWYNAIKGGGYTKGFLQCSARGTNEYRDRCALAYLVNRFQNVSVKDLFEKNGICADETLFSLSEMLQWIWRSAIRDGKPIQIYIPSSRMRNLLIRWMDDVSKGVRY